MRNFTIIFLLVFACGLVYSQGESIGDDENFTYPNIIPPSPTAYELGKYGNLPVGLFTGTPNISIPIYTYKTKNLAVPISLSYSTNGLKVDQLSSNVGLGWNLNMGGVVTRVIRDLDDLEGRLYYPDEVLTGQMNTPMAMEFFKVAQEAEIDSEPDIYMYNFNGYSGSFVFDNQKRIVMLPDKPLNIEMTCLASECGFKITTPDGVEYFFLDEELTMSRTYGGGVHTTPTTSTSSWYLTKIAHYLGDTIFLDYTGNSYNYTSGKSESIKVPKAGSIISPSISSSYQWINLTGLNLSHIYSNNPQNGEVFINYNTNHPSINGFKLVSDIQIKNQANELVERCDLDYITTSNSRIFLGELTFLDPSKIYEFDYINPGSFPQRLSFAQDHWGYYNGQNGNSTLVPKPEGYYQFNNFSNPANREPDFTYSKFGLLEKVTYPTKGSTELIYETNSHYGDEISFPDKESIQLDITSYEGYYRLSDTITINNIPFSQKLELKYMNVSYIDSVEISCPPSDENLELSAYFVVMNSQNQIQTIVDCTNPYINFQTMEILEGMAGDCYYVDLEAGEDYFLELYVNKPCITANITVEYYNQLPDTIQKNIETGGIRIFKTIDYDPITQNRDTITYYYGPLSDYQTSSGDLGVSPRYLSTIEKYTEKEIPCTFDIEEFYLVSSSSLMSLFSSSGSSICYEYVSISRGDENFGEGAEEHRFIINRDLHGNNIKGQNIITAPLSNTGWDNGLEKAVSYYKNDGSGGFILLNKTENEYKTDGRGFDQVLGYTVRKRYNKSCVPDYSISCDASNVNDFRPFKKCIADHKHTYAIIGATPCIASGAENVWDTLFHPCYFHNIGDTVMPYYIDNLDVMEYNNNSYWHYLNKTTNWQYDEDGTNPLITTTKYYYDNHDHLQLTRSVASTSDGDSIITFTYYPDDIVHPDSLPGGTLSQEEFNMISALKSDSLFRIAEPIQTMSYENQKLLYTKRKLYDSWYGIVLPSLVSSAKGTNALEEQYTYHQYDARGNPVEISKSGGTHVSYLWGYNHSRIIAEITNATFQQVCNSLTVTYEQLQSKTGTELQNLINILRNDLSDASIVSYTHDPIIGIKSQTDANGITTHYEYDSYGRLETIRDADSVVLKHIDYHYHEPQNP